MPKGGLNDKGLFSSHHENCKGGREFREPMLAGLVCDALGFHSGTQDSRPTSPTLSHPPKQGRRGELSCVCARFERMLHRLCARLLPFSDLCDHREGKARLACWREEAHEDRGAPSPEPATLRPVQINCK